MEKVLNDLRAVLCDPEGKCCISGSDGDRAIVDACLSALDRAAVAAQPEAAGWVKAVQSFADELELPFREAKSFLDEVFPQWMADKEAAGFVTLRLDDLIESDSYGVDGSDFYRCRICHAESGAGMLNSGIKHEHDCPLASAPTIQPTQPVQEREAAQLEIHLRNLIGEYWSLAYAEGNEGREHDTEAGDAQRVHGAIDKAINDLRAALSTPAQAGDAGEPSDGERDVWTNDGVDDLCWSAFESAMASGVSVDSFRWLANSLRAKQLPARATKGGKL